MRALVLSLVFCGMSTEIAVADQALDGNEIQFECRGKNRFNPDKLAREESSYFFLKGDSSFLKVQNLYDSFLDDFLTVETIGNWKKDTDKILLMPEEVTKMSNDDSPENRNFILLMTKHSPERLEMIGHTSKYVREGDGGPYIFFCRKNSADN